MKSIVIYRLGSMGDTIVALPCFNKINQTFPSYKKYLITNFAISKKAISIEELLCPAGLIDEIIEYPIGLRSIMGFFKLRRTLKATGSNTLIYLKATQNRFSCLRDIVFFRLCGFSKIIGAPLTGSLQSGKLDSEIGLVEFESERLARSIKSLGPIDLDSQVSWSLHLTDREYRHANKMLQHISGDKYFVINMGGKDPRKDWGLKNWKCLISELYEFASSHALIVIGSNDEVDISGELLKEWPNGGINLCGVLAPRETACILAGASFFIGHDSGPLHLAASVQVPCVGIYGDLNKPNQWHPYGTFHKVIHSMTGIGAITVSEVVSAVCLIANSSLVIRNK